MLHQPLNGGEVVTLSKVILADLEYSFDGARVLNLASSIVNASWLFFLISGVWVELLFCIFL
jgi:hypothetical protein